MNGKKVMIGLSGGINSAAVLCWLIESGDIPAELHLYYAHFKEHSPDTAHFVIDLIRLARKKFPVVHVTITRHSIIDFFKKEKMIPHPMVSPCSKRLKIEPMERYSFEHGVEVDLIGYVKHELKRRTERQAEQKQSNMFGAVKEYPIGEFTDDWCFEIVDSHIGWHPAIYNILDEKGRRAFKHNNCLPCKNMTTNQMKAVERHYIDNHKQALKLSAELNSYWGRDSAVFYSTWGRDLGQDSTCEACKF